MRKITLEKLCCPFDKALLKVTIVAIDMSDNIQEGYLHCSTCNRIYPIVMGIPIMNPDEYREIKYEKPLYERWSKQLNGKYVSDFRLSSYQTSSRAIEE
ncbi:MAG: hypothetical protein N2662_11580 [Bacteroidales bacterium]|nr:hypothetical protein [Bacteroidales bacterium]